MNAASASGLYIGLMSGTSMDGVDGVLAWCETGSVPRIVAHAELPMPELLRTQLLELNRPGADEIDRMSRAALALTQLYADVVARLLALGNVAATEVRAIGAHGQTVRHRPDAGYTVQLNAPAQLAETCGIAVVADLRSRDVAAGGQGAPLVPALHAALFGTEQACVVVNLGGIANVTLLDPRQPTRGFDTGPANVLLDLWCLRHTGRHYDDNGAYAATGRVDAALRDHLIATEPWFAAAPPKSTGRDLFNAEWLDRRLASWQAAHGAVAAADVQATLQSLTAHTVAQAVMQHAPHSERLWVCGGGARNQGLMRDLAQAVQRPVLPTDERGVPAQQVEALAFAWLAQRHLAGLPGNLPDVTGARGPRVLGALYPV
jgi:anhydro-N-acetylmuramic acid kinase